MLFKSKHEAIDSLVSKSGLKFTDEEKEFRKTIQNLIKAKSTVNKLFSCLPEGETRPSSKDSCLASINDTIAALAAMACTTLPTLDAGIDAGRLVYKIKDEEVDIYHEILFLTKG